MRTRTLLLLATALTVASIAAAGVATGGPAPSQLAHSDTRPAQSPVLRASAVLRAWDGRRAAAWSHADAGALSRLYTPRSRAGRSDVRDLHRWHRRGLRVVGLRQQVVRLVVRAETSYRLVLTVTDRTVDAIAVGHHRRTALPASAWARHRIRLRRAHGTWLVDDVVDQPAR